MTQPDYPNYRALCAELLEWAERTSSHYYKQADVIVRARAALAQPEPVAPTDEELDELSWNWYSKTGSTWWQIDSYRAFARAALERWGRA